MGSFPSNKTHIDSRWIYHGKNDEVIPLKAVEQMAEKYFSHNSFHKVDDDHFLHNTFKIIDWDRLLGP